MSLTVFMVSLIWIIVILIDIILITKNNKMKETMVVVKRDGKATKSRE